MTHRTVKIKAKSEDGTAVSQWHLIHRAAVDKLGTSWFGHCLVCGWVGSFRRWRWLAKRDADRHILGSAA